MGIFLDKDEGLYAFPDGSTGWEGEQRNSAITHSWLNRNALHVDTTGNISKHKTIIQKIIDGYKGVLDEDVFQKSFQTPEEIQTAISKFLKNSGLQDSIREENIEVLISNLKKALPHVDAKTHFELYSEAGIRNIDETNPYCDIGYGISTFNFVKLSDKEKYIRDFAKNILNSISFSVSELDCNREFLSLYMELGYISEKEVKEKIREVLIYKGLEIYNKSINNEFYHQSLGHIADFKKYILAFCFVNGTITKEMSLKLYFDDGANLEYYILNYGRVNLINIYYNKLFNNLLSEETEKYFRF